LVKTGEFAVKYSKAISPMFLIPCFLFEGIYIASPDVTSLVSSSIIAIIKHRPDTIQSRLTALAVVEVGISGIVAAELWYGVALSQRFCLREYECGNFKDS
jgi:hypothetical protein